MGKVFRAKDHASGAAVALKISTSDEHAGRFLEEAAALARIDHPGVVRYVAHGRTDDGAAYLAMEWIEGRTLHDLVRAAPLDVDGAVQIGVRVAQALGAAHRAGILHRDVKPSNIMLAGGALDAAVVVDFGLARRSDQQISELTQSGVMVGTPAYMAPEQARGRKNLDARVDVFALGCVLFRAITGTPAFSGDGIMAVLAKLLFEPTPRIRDVVPGAPRWLDALVFAMMSPDPSGRPRDGDAVAEALLAPPAVPLDTPSEVTITGAEQRFVSVIMVGLAPPAKLDAADDEETVSIPSDALRIFEHYGARVERLVNGALVGVLTDQAQERGIRAARCALDLRRAFPDPPLGLASGRADLSKRSAMGEVIESAAALLRKCDAGVIVDEATRALLEGRFDVTAEGRLQGELAPTLDARRLLGKATPCVGRDNEVGSLVGFVARSLEDGAGAMLVTAPAGYGKSRLRYELVRRLSRDLAGCEVWLARGDVMGAGSPYALTTQLVSAAIDLRAGEGAAERRAKVSARVASLGLPARVATFLCEMLGCGEVDAPPEVDLARRDARLMLDQVRAAWRAWVAAETARRPVVLILEDLHWGDLPSVGLVDATLDTELEARLAVVAFARPEVRETLPDLWSERTTSELRLGPLGKRPARELARSVLGPDVPEDTIARIVETAGGNAFYLEELVRVAAGGGAELPTTVIAMSEARLERLDPVRRRTLRAASVFGQAFWPSAVARLLGISAEEVRSLFALLSADELVSTSADSRFAGEAQLRFRHALVREAAYATLTDEDRKLAHGVAAEWLSEHGEHDHLTMAQHFERSASPGRAVPHLVRLAEQALDAGDLAGAIARAEQARKLDARGEDLGRAMLVVAEIAIWQGQPGIDAANLAVTSLPEGSRDWCRAVSCAGILAARFSRPELQDHLEERVLALTADGASPDLLVALAQVIFARIAAFKPVSELVARLEQHRESAHSASAYVRVRVEHSLYLSKLNAGGLSLDDDARLDAVLTELEQLGDERNAVYYRLNLAFGRHSMGRFEDAIRDCERALVVSRRLKLTYVTMFALSRLGGLAWYQGRYADAKAYYGEVLAGLSAESPLRASVQAELARVAFGEGNVAEAERFAKVVDVATAAAAARGVARSVLARVAMARGDLASAVALAREASELVRDLHIELDNRVAIFRVLADVHLARGEDAEARAAVDVARSLLLKWARNLRGASDLLRRNDDYARVLDLADRLGV